MDDDPIRSQNENTNESSGLVDWNAALEVTGGDVPLLIEVLDAFCTETPQMIKSIHEALSTGDAELLNRAAHTAKNAYYSIGAKSTGDLAYKVERLGKAAAFEQVPPLLEQLELAMQQVEREVAQFMQEKRGG